MNEGWLCPKCGNAHAPHVNSCPMGAGWTPVQTVPSLEPRPNPWRGNDVPVWGAIGPEPVVRG